MLLAIALSKDVFLPPFCLFNSINLNLINTVDIILWTFLVVLAFKALTLTVAINITLIKQPSRL